MPLIASVRGRAVRVRFAKPALAALSLHAALTAPATAGLALDEALARSEALRRGEPTPLSIASARGDGFVLAIGGPGGDVPPLLRPELRGEGGIRVATSTTWLGGAVEARLGGVYEVGERRPLTFDGSTLAARLGAGEVYASVERRHWGPAWASSLILDAGARPLPAIGWRKTTPERFSSPWLSWLGPWQVDFFAGQLSQQRPPRGAKLLGGRMQVMPLPGLELGASRTIQWGGTGRPETLRSLWDAISGDDNIDTPGDAGLDPGNQLAGFDARWQLRFDGDRAASIYAETIGEDEAGGLPSKRMLTVGADAAFALAGTRWRVFVERADVTLDTGRGQPIYTGAYRHATYQDGYTQLGSPLGHPAGGDIRLWSAGAYTAAGRLFGALLVHRGTALATSQLYPGGGRLQGGHLELAWRVGDASTVGVMLMRWRDPRTDDDFTRGQLVVRHRWR